MSTPFWRRPWLLGAAALAVLVGAGVLLRGKPAARPRPTTPAVQLQPEAVSALGRLEPAGDVRRLAAPITGMAGSPRITALLVQEGQRVSAGQLLASFDNRPGLLADQRVLQTRIANLSQQLNLLERDTRRYRSLAQGGVTPRGDLDNREIKLIELRGQLSQARAQLAKVETDLVLSELRAPISGSVLRIIARPGERPGDAGILEIGATDRMEAVAEVYESDIARVRPGQRVRLISENGGFQGSLNARVLRITPQVRQRQLLSTDPTGDADARIVEVRLALDPADAAKVNNLAGMKIIARFNP
ncbi:MAG: HlyD family efflux transporter periplasmic adaptor subunit [Synechococcaceae bacterium WB8_1B_136]|nr:HlyD family efflux transporter periplasmic adaptor subunit [Synechococcaceae bacterium WB8_1B_136]